MKTNLAILCLSKFYAKRIGKQLADSLDMFFVDINDLLEYNLVNNDMLATSGKTYFDAEEQKVVNGISGYENSCIVCSFDILNKNKNFEKLKRNSIFIYLRFTDKNLMFIEKKFSVYGVKSNFAFDSEDLICRMQSDFIVEMEIADEKNLKNIRQKLLKFCK